jgi:hypothetical protein
MKKLIAIFAVLLLAAPAMAADWSFYGSQRMSTFYIYDDFGDFNRQGVLNGPGANDDWGLNWNFQDNSRLGAKVKADKVSGQIELSLNAADSNTGQVGGEANGSNGGDGHVNARRAYGVWKFADNASLKVGKDYSPVSNLVSGQVFGDDAGLLGNGDFYGKRPGQIALQIGDFEIAAITNALKASPGPAGSDPDWNLPKLEARYTFKAGMFELIPFGGFQYFKVSDDTSALTDDLDIYSYVVGGVARVNIGAFYIAAEGAYGQNWNNANWSTGLNPGSATASSATLDGTDDVNDSTSWQALGLAGLNFTPTLKFEAGFGYRYDDGDVSGQDDIDSWCAYGQVVATLAPGVYLVPEVGYIAKGDNFTGDDTGYQWYAGAKWQIDF